MVLTTILAVAAFALGEYATAAVLLIPFECANQFESRAARSGRVTRRSILGLSVRLEGKLADALNAYRSALRYQHDYRFTTRDCRQP